MVKNPQQSRSAFIFNEISIVFLKLLGTVNMRLSQAKNKTNNNFAVLSGLTLIIVKRDFYQFQYINARSLQTCAIIKKKIYNKGIQYLFTSVITLTEQMQQHENKLFKAMLTRARKSLFNNNNIIVLNNKVIARISILNLNK